jgi:hypothetical protein
MPDAPVTYPLGPPTASGTLITLDQLVQAPTVITRSIAAYSTQKMYANKVFSPGPAVNGGAILYERPNPLLTDLYASRRMQVMAPGTEAPELTFLRGVPMVAVPRKIGGKFRVTKEERQRNQPQVVLNAITQAGNTLLRNVEEMALGELNAVITAESRTVGGQSWTAASEEEWAKRTEKSQPLRDFINAQVTIENEERGIVLDSAIINPLDWATLATVYGDTAGVNEMLTSTGITNVYKTPRQVRGKVKLFQEGAVGIWSNEFPIDQNTWIADETDRTFWYQWTVSPAFAVTNQFAVVELTGIE